MQVKSLATTLGIGMLAGAAAIMMLPKDSSAYRTVDDAAQGVKNAVQNMMDM